MKKKLTLFISMILALTMAFSFAACKDDNPTGGGGLPTAQEWAEVGVSGSFTAEVVGTLAKSQVTEEGDISMKWTGSNEQSLDNTIAWLKGEGYNSYGGQSAEKITDGFIKTYTAEKIVGGVSAMSANENGAAVVVPMSYTYASAEATPQESKTMIAESYYVTADFSVMGVTYKAGELYLDIYEEEAYTPPSGLVSTWPASDILTVLGTSIPAYTGTSTSYQVSDFSMGYIKNVQIFVYGASEADATAYNALLSQNGFTVNADELYTKRLESGDELQVGAYMTQTVDPSSYQTTNVLMINAMLEKNSGAYTFWSGLNLSEFSAAGIPAYSGGSSFDIDDVATDGMISIEEYEAMIAQLAPYEHLLDAEIKAELAEAKEMVELATQVRAKVITVYGTTIDEVEAYETALSTAGFASGLKNVGDFQYQVEISDDEDKAIISIVKVPIELAEDIDNSGGTSANQASKYTIPQNVKIVYDDDVYQYIIYKIGENYYVGKQYLPDSALAQYSSGMIDQTYYKKNGNVWDIYTKGETDTDWVKDTDWQENDITYLERDVFNFIVEIDEVEEAVETGTQTVAGKNCAIYELDTGYYKMVYYVDEESKLIFKSEMYYASTLGMTYEITVFDATVTAFEVTLPQ